MNLQEIRSASAHLGISAESIVDAIGDDLLSELSREDITLERIHEIYDIGVYNALVASTAVLVAIRVIRDQLNAAKTLKDLSAVEKGSAHLLYKSALSGTDVWDVGSRRYEEIGEALLEEFKDDILRLLEIRQMLLVTRFGTSNIRETIVLRVNELLQIELADPAVSWIRAREIYDFELSTYETRKAAIKVLLRLLPN